MRTEIVYRHRADRKLICWSSNKGSVPVDYATKRAWLTVLQKAMGWVQHLRPLLLLLAVGEENGDNNNSSSQTDSESPPYLTSKMFMMTSMLSLGMIR